ncbi:MAG: hypothetical protein RH860_05975 [Cytophagales bacterium]
MKGIKLFIIFFLFLNGFLFAQSDNSPFTFRGYVKQMSILNFFPGDSLITDNFIHNRLNLQYDLNSKIVARVEMRNRIFYGESVRLNPFYQEMIDVDPGYLDLSFIWMEHSGAFAHSIFDRAWIGYVDGNFEAKAGRQRINWGMNVVWNPNDIFNAFNFVDFDYEERPGNDAIRLQNYFGSGNKIELAYAPGRTENEHIGAFMYKFNKGSYDIQVLGGVFRDDYVAGIGWAGNLKTAGFKGEASYFVNREKNYDTVDVLSLSASVDYSFKNGLYMLGSFLINSNGRSSIIGLENTNSLAGNNFSAKNLMLTRYSGFYQLNYPVTPLFSPGLAAIYGFEADLLFIMPSMTYSIASNWDLDLVGQLYFVKFDGKYQNLVNSIFTRVKWSF